MIFISYFTPDGDYPVLARKLQASLDRFGLCSDVQERPAFGDWAAGCQYKARFILEKLLQYRKPVVWMDVDTEVWQYPQLLFGEHDFAIYNWTADRGHHLDGHLPFDPASRRLVCSGGVHKWGYTAPAIELLLRWLERLQAHPAVRDDVLLNAAWKKFQPPVNALWLPKTYNRMDKLSRHWAEIKAEEVVINHDYFNGQHREPSMAAG